ncbi:hypothetical protein [Photobacterium lipolyticum]|uniref:Coiled coil domain-containing protein n=1 Tax=Photobacterium lipolyticum TaxID=266810 RepID=A0A2T3MZY0_9GAMM|nr:hypothetical protein [Photobacterium lipolyticum]PSW05445.1 hypothetical protein C9I89_09350 [Photobacterium lipolyticum]
MSERQRYVDQMKLKLDQWNKDIDELEDKVKTAGSDMKDEYQNNLATLKKKRDEATQKFEELQSTTDSAWGDVKDGFEHAWMSISNGVTSAKNKLFDKGDS